MNNLICDCEVQGQPRPSDGNCNKCGYEMMDDDAIKCPTCRKSLINTANIEAVKYWGECVSCDHARGDQSMTAWEKDEEYEPNYA